MRIRLGRIGNLLDGVREELPRVGTAGSRSARLHGEDGTKFDVGDEPDTPLALSLSQARKFFLLRWIGTVGALMIGLGGLGAGALPVVGNPFGGLPFGQLMGRMLVTSSALVLIGVGLIVIAWVLMAPMAGNQLRASSSTPRHSITRTQVWGTFFAWTLPIIATAPLFTQDIYSYIANGSIVVQGMDPYSAGPVQLLGADNDLARSVPFIWANSPSPYGPVALGIAGIISVITSDSIVAAVILHRVASILGVIAAGWAISRLAVRCRVAPSSALWLGILNPLSILHLIGGIHNESIMLGFALVGMELALRGIDKLQASTSLSMSSAWPAWLLIIGGGVLISAAGMVKVTGFIGLGFAGMALARFFAQRLNLKPYLAISSAAGILLAVLLATIAAFTVLSGIGLGWITGQGGAVSIRSWLSVSTDVGVASGFMGMMLGLGDHTEAILSVTRAVGIVVAAAFMVRMLFATFRGVMHPIGGLGVSTLVLVVLFPVVHPWYILWAIFPLAAWANRLFFRYAVIIYSAIMSFVVLPRGLGLPAGTVAQIYLTAAVSMAVLVTIGWVALRLNRGRILD
ncbi:MAG: polyprenol phosphomannose-dependent alpha 1,6 mannosyltransferase MptB [Corynebacterium casei]|uniref:polyprenol phosphomannose-dependent alpha 1,6 mannosyltransferase MptB n=1 Tax=Corynebacterium casei TaxID=160386 RepID=UPI00264A1282|nr:polyprenol phosphomannose-dependent alpha 1,6 mannosyltransferase MptB [Corynebacterium casei]MDN5825921.1 polyprenol phosphomannose-dependent alpha 1,6 mannosyltransferase MptB [Corynebacterium casei]MDN5840711.1 polyprenol phosphomannose-dependent alpha 1,6 mannosyltransferase MptB [Corynebacterium casei]MDN6273566.1 polyprenol phosphomannose-dependent alpha 1,6 mannosyltransferase MptB [Corynebacterium casei]MDN6392756.1 polyprenol phosphomannose-dependent alpha 1,6 mannosyltransferase Mp